MTPENWTPIAALEHNAGRHVAYSGEHTTAYGQHPAPAGAFFYYSLALHLDPDQAAATIADLPVALILTRDMEHCLLPLTTDTNCWHIAEAFCRLGILPPATELHPNPVIALLVDAENADGSGTEGADHREQDRPTGVVPAGRLSARCRGRR
ncbi:hypothetical protein OH809_24825 [Streptomyces sp. NBC_00873]|uniref:hypothetical protein n=1 Tax=Streptomyces sp. NBC_00873 TaxID=2975852 RepID=UPI0038698544|nr:hypothetical protein OH809_24825 [Streptomyces sp. NBC_00873]